MTQQFTNLYTASQVRELDRLAIEEAGIPGYSLMKKAGASAFHYIMSIWPATRKMTVFCGTGNNGGDGYVIAKLAKIRGLDVKVIQLGDISIQSGDALTARKELIAEGRSDDLIIEHFSTEFDPKSLLDDEVIVDALLGIGLQRDVNGLWEIAINVINQSKAKVASVDIPSGLNSDTGVVQGVAVKADISITFIGRKQGMYTASGRDVCGDIIFESLNIPQTAFHKVGYSSQCLPLTISDSFLKPRKRNSHKGSYGNILLIGGSPGMNGAILLSAIAALRTGCGLVTVLTHPDHAAYLNINQPEVMCRGIETPEQLEKYMSAADVVVIGPGLGTDIWGRNLIEAVVRTNKPLVIDADGLNNLASETLSSCKSANANWVLTPHPGEAGKLLNCSIDEIQSNRFDAAKQISEKYNAVCALKGAGTIIYFQNKTYVCAAGNPGMATAGMGDVLSGILGTLIAQTQTTVIDAVNNAVSLHALAGDNVARLSGEKGMLASDLFPEVRRILNGVQHAC